MQCEAVNAVADAIIDGIGEFGWLRPDTVLADQQGFRAEVDAQESRTGPNRRHCAVLEQAAQAQCSVLRSRMTGQGSPSKQTVCRCRRQCDFSSRQYLL
ncbi:hypothetical protein FOXYSP1_12700 [Fusarium oxysporum f. sp. phaseoli]